MIEADEADRVAVGALLEAEGAPEEEGEEAQNRGSKEEPKLSL